MYLENVVFDAVEPQRLGRFWEAALGGARLTDEPAAFETRVCFDGVSALDLCFQRVAVPPVAPPRLLLDLMVVGGARRGGERLIGLGARRDTLRADSSALVLHDAEGNPCRVLDAPAPAAGPGSLAALRLQSADPLRDADFWSWLSGWVAAPGDAPSSLRHRSLHGPVLELTMEAEPKGETKNRLHLDVRLETADDPDDVASAIIGRGGRELVAAGEGLPWRVYRDPSGNEFCVLPARS